MADSLRQRHQRRLEDLKSKRTRWESHWQDLADFIAPKRYRRNETDDERAGDKARHRIVDNAGGFALRTLASGLHSGITSPARPWFRLTTMDPDLREVGSVKTWLATCEMRMRHVMASSNMYNAFHTGYGDLGLFGQSAALMYRDPIDYITVQQLVHGEFWLACDHRGRVSTLYRRCRMTAEQMVGRFGYKNVSRSVQHMYDKGNKDERVTVYHAVEPRMDRNPNLPDKRNMAFLSNYWEDGADEDRLLEESGFKDNPIIAPRWAVVGNDDYGQSPAMEALPDVKMLQKEQTQKLEGIDKIVRPPMKGPTSLKNEPKSLLPGSITYVDDPNGNGFTPVMQVNLRLAELAADIQETRERINRAFYADLFLMLANMEGVQPRNQLEISERKEEKLLALGPVLERMYAEQLNPAIDITFNSMMESGILPEPPRELQQDGARELKVDFISTLAQAQKAVSTGSIERVAGFIGNLAGGKPEVLDKFDADQAVDEYADMVGVPPSIILSDDRVAEIRKQRLEQAQQQQQMQQMAAVAPAVRDGAQAAQILSQTDDGGGGTVGNLLANLGIAGP